MNTENAMLLQSLRNGDEEALRRAYHENRPAFLRWARANYGSNEADFLDFYQDAMVVFYQNVKNGRLQNLDNGPVPYLIGICKKLMQRRAFLAHREPAFDPAEEVFLQNLDFSMDAQFDREHVVQTLETALDQMGENCLKIIRWFYYLGYSTETIAQRLNYSSEEVVRVLRMRCLRQLRQILQFNPQIN